MAGASAILPERKKLGAFGSFDSDIRDTDLAMMAPAAVIGIEPLGLATSSARFTRSAEACCAHWSEDSPQAVLRTEVDEGADGARLILGNPALVGDDRRAVCVSPDCEIRVRLGTLTS